MDKAEPNERFDFSEITAAMAAATAGVPFEPIAQKCGVFQKELKKIHPVKAAATYGALLLQKTLQPNCLRLEVLVHLCLVAGQGIRAPTSQLITQGYTAVGGIVGYMEDPPEDIFVGNIYSKRGNYRVLEGIWESGTFYLQRFVNMTDDFPNTGKFASIANSIHALLQLSDIVCSRAGLKRNELGGQRGEHTLPRKIAAASDELRQRVRCSFEDLSNAGIDIDDLLPFVFDANKRGDLIKQSLSHSDLESHPLAIDGDQLYLLLPTAISVAIRRYFIEAIGLEQNRQIFLNKLGQEYSHLYSETPLLGAHTSQVPFSHMSWGSLCCMSKQVDEGRYLNLVFFLDTLENFNIDSFAGMYLGNDRFDKELGRAIKSMQAEISETPGFRDGITLLIGCGIGRGVSLQTELQPVDGWGFEFLSAPDLCTLSRVKNMEPLNLWRITQMRSSLQQMNVWLQNINGLLNLYAWAESLGGHLIPHANVPPDSINSKSLCVSIVQNRLIDLRHKVANSVDLHVEQFVDGTWRLVLTEGSSYFNEDDRQPLYGHLNTKEGGRPLGAYISTRRCWWYDIALATSSYDRWKMLGTWITRAVPVLEQVFSAKLGEAPILWHCEFEQPQETTEINSPGNMEEAIAAIRTTVKAEQRGVTMYIGSGFDRAIYHPENIAERALVNAFIRGVAQLANDTETDLVELESLIVPNIEARHAHMFPAQGFRDYIRALHSEEPVTISHFDDAATKLGMGWLVRSPSQGGQIEGKAHCLEYLNALVTRLEDDLCQHLKTFNRRGLLSKILFNHEVASCSRDRWHKTAAAMLALRRDKTAALGHMKEHDFRLNAVFQSGRNLLEMAICEASLEGGLVPGDLDLSRLLAQASQLYHLSGWSDLIRWDFLPASLIVRPFGDVHADLDFIDTVMDGFGSATSNHKHAASVKNYANNLKAPDISPTLNGKLEERFLTAWQEEFGVEIDAYRRFLDAVENWAIERQMPVVEIAHSELIKLADTLEIGAKIVDSMTLMTRDAWRNLPFGYDNKDIAHWRFRRRLSVLRRPFLQITAGEDPQIVVAPGFLREGFAYTVRNYFEASYPDWHLGPAMARYAGYARNRDGMQFNQEVKNQMCELGWSAQPEVTITKIIGKALDRNYGDVDVLAWDENSSRILVMECKDLQFRKTYGEIAEQLSDFRGETSLDGKRRDLLRKHLDRVDVLRKHKAEVKKYLRLKGDCVIESLVIFKNPVPMQFAGGAILEYAKIYIFDDLHRLNIVSRDVD